MVSVGTALQKHVEHAATGTPDFGIVGVGLQLHFLHCFERCDDDGAIGHVGDWDTVEQVVIAARRTAGDRNLRRTGLVLHARVSRIAHLLDIGRELRKHIGVAAEIGQIDHLLPVNHLALGSGGRLNQRDFLGDVHALGNAADFHLHIDRDLALGLHQDTLAAVLFEAGIFHADRVGAGNHLTKNIFACRQRNGRA